jgi:hypothetical protein
MGSTERACRSGAFVTAAPRGGFGGSVEHHPSSQQAQHHPVRVDRSRLGVCQPDGVIGPEPGLELSATQARVLGSLLEKELTTPDAYPVTLNALTTACNQTSNRDPVVRYEPSQVETAVLTLKAKGLARVVHPGAGERATKYRQVADEALRLAAAERAVLCVLLLRGAQTVVELRSRTQRLHGFAGPAEVEVVLDGLAGREPALVARVDRVAGQKEPRWIQLLEVDAGARAAVGARPSVAPDRGEAADDLTDRVAALERRLAGLIEALGDLVEIRDEDAAVRSGRLESWDQQGGSGHEHDR